MTYRAKCFHVGTSRSEHKAKGDGVVFEVPKVPYGNCSFPVLKEGAPLRTLRAQTPPGNGEIHSLKIFPLALALQVAF